MRLTDLAPEFIKFGKGIADEDHGRTLEDGTTQWGGFEIDIITVVPTLAEADAIMFLCPKCYRDNGSVGIHRVRVYFRGRGTPQWMNRGVRWDFSGTDFTDLSTTPSILMLGGCAGTATSQTAKYR